MNYASLVKVISDVGATVVLTSLFVWMLIVSAPRTHEQFGITLEKLRDRDDAAAAKIAASVSENTKAVNALSTELIVSRRVRTEERKIDAAKEIEDEKEFP